MARRNPASTMALLQKASTQLRGERVQTKKNTDEDDIEAYLSTLSKRTTDQQKKSTKFEEMGDISISTSEDTAPKIHETTKVINNKFLKKTPVGRDQNEMGISSQKQQMPEKQFLKGSQSAVSKTQRKADVMAVHNKSGVQGSSALNKAAALTNRITQRAGNVGRSIARLETESDDSLSTTRDKSRPKSVSEDSLKKDGRKFLKKAKSVETPPEEIPARPSTPARHAVRDHKYRTSRSFTSEDESLAGFMDEFSKSEVSSSPKRSPQPPRYGRSSPMSPLSRASTPDSKPPRSPSPSLSPRASYRPSSPKRWSPGQRNLRRSHSDSSIVSDSMASDIADGSSDDGFKINVMDIDALEPIIDTKEIPREKSKNKRSKSKEDQEDSSFKAMSKEEKQSVFKSRGKKKQEPKESRSIFRSFGLQTVDDLFSKSSDNNIDQTESSVISEIKTERSTGRFSKKRRGDSFSEIASVPDEYSPRQQSYSEDFEESISERIGVSSDTNKPPTSGSEIKTQYSRSGTGRDYSDDFVSDDETIITESYSTRRTSESSYYDSYISDTETITRSADSQRDKKYVSTQDMEMQTEGGLLLNGGFAMRTPAYGLGFVDPTPIATHVVSADALEAMTAYSPTMIALHDMLRMQLDLTNQFIESQKLMYSSYVDTIESNFKYTSLESTKKYIEKHRKPKLTFKQALKQVSKEMNR